MQPGFFAEADEIQMPESKHIWEVPIIYTKPIGFSEIWGKHLGYCFFFFARVIKKKYPYASISTGFNTLALVQGKNGNQLSWIQHHQEGSGFSRDVGKRNSMETALQPKTSETFWTFRSWIFQGWKAVTLGGFWVQAAKFLQACGFECVRYLRESFQILYSDRWIFLNETSFSLSVTGDWVCFMEYTPLFRECQWGDRDMMSVVTSWISCRLGGRLSGTVASIGNQEVDRWPAPNRQMVFLLKKLFHALVEHGSQRKRRMCSLQPAFFWVHFKTFNLAGAMSADMSPPERVDDLKKSGVFKRWRCQWARTFQEKQVSLYKKNLVFFWAAWKTRENWPISWKSMVGRWFISF